jgi:hypothetical protein
LNNSEYSTDHLGCGKKKQDIMCGSVAGKTGEREREIAAMRRTRQVVGF